MEMRFEVWEKWEGAEFLVGRMKHRDDAEILADALSNKQDNPVYFYVKEVNDA